MNQAPIPISVPARTGRIASTPAWLIILICLVYVISPIDLLPDVLPFIGQLDDLAVLGMTGFEVVRRVVACISNAQTTTSNTKL